MYKRPNSLDRRVGPVFWKDRGTDQWTDTGTAGQTDG